ncbi:MAG: hypothetical protein KAT70_04135 [Thermoplasmata archaeon]|nr:hypothetical protein [Thermoplasmata archaeon]
MLSLDELSLGETIDEKDMEPVLHIRASVPIPPGLLILSSVFETFIEPHMEQIEDILRSDTSNLEASKAVEELLLEALLPPGLELELARAFKTMLKEEDWCLLLPPRYDVMTTFSYPVVNDKLSFLRKVLDMYSRAYDPEMVAIARGGEKFSCPILALVVGNTFASGTAVVDTGGSLQITASRGWMAYTEYDLYELSMVDGSMRNTDIREQVSIHQLSSSGFQEIPVSSGESSARKLSDTALLDIYGFAQRMMEGKAKTSFSFSWLLSPRASAAAMVLSYAEEGGKEERAKGEEGDMGEMGDEEGMGGVTRVVGSGVNEDTHPSTSPIRSATSSSAPLSSPTHSNSPLPVTNGPDMGGAGLNLPVQPTATGLVSIGGRHPWFPLSVSPWISDPSSLTPAEDVMDIYVSLEGQIPEDIVQTVTSARAGRVFLVIAPDLIPELLRRIGTSLSRDRVLVLARISETSEAFITDDMTEGADGVMVDTRVSGPRAEKVLSRAVETVIRALGPNKKVVVNASGHFWSEEFLSYVISSGVYALAVGMNDVAVASHMVAGIERRLLLRGGIGGMGKGEGGGGRSRGGYNAP